MNFQIFLVSLDPILHSWFKDSYTVASMDEKMHEILKTLLDGKNIDKDTCNSILSKKNSGERFKKFEEVIFQSGKKVIKAFLYAWERASPFCKFFLFFSFLSINLILRLYMFYC